MKREELVLLYQFHDAERLERLRAVLKALHIRVRVLKDEDHAEKIGFLLGLKGFQPAKEREEFTFPHEVMVLQNIRHKRLDAVLEAIKEAGIPKIQYKAVVTPFNTLWTLQRLCETMQKEHGAMMDGAAEENA